LIDASLETLLKTQPSLWRGRDQQQQHDTLKTGFASLDRALPGGGLSPGTLTELLVEHQGIGELSLLLPTLKNMTQQQLWVAMVNTPHIPYAPAFANAEVSLDHLLIVDTTNEKDTLWATEQLLRAGTFTLVICWLYKTSTAAQRRLQLAAETGKSVAIAYRPAATAKDSSAAALRISLAAQRSKNKDQHTHAGLQLHILKSRGGKNQSVFINASDFDQFQGVEWPATNGPSIW